MMNTVRDIRLSVWRGVTRLSLSKIAVVLLLNGVIIWVVWPSGETYDLSHMAQHRR